MFKSPKRELRHAKVLRSDNDFVPFLPYTRHVDDTVIALENDGYMMMFALEGRQFETCDADELNAWHNRLNIVLRSIADDRLSIWTHMVRKPTFDYAEGDFGSQFAKELDAKYRRKVQSSVMYYNDFYVTLLVKPASEIGSSFYAKKSANGVDVDQKLLAFLREKASDFVKLFDMCDPEPLGLYEYKGVVFSRPMEVLQYVMTGEFVRVPLINGPLGQALYSSRLIFGSETVEVRSPTATRLVGLFGIREYVANTQTGQFNELLKMDFPLVVTQSFSFLGKAEATDKFKRKRNQMSSSSDDAASQVVALFDATDDLASNRFVVGDHHMVVAVSAEYAGELIDRLSATRAAMADTGMVVARESVGLEAAFWSQLPGNFKVRARPATITSRNFAAFSPFYTHPHGRRTGNHWGDAVALFKTNAGSPYWFNYHMNDLGHTLVIGPSGGGKTVVQNFLMSQLEKLGARRLFIDKDRGAEIFVRACGGTYLTLKNGAPTGFAPFKALSNSASDVSFLRRFVRELVKRDGETLTVEQEMTIDSAVKAVLALRVEERTLANLRVQLGFKDAGGVGARVEKWCSGGALGWAFDNGADELDLDKAFIGLDMTEFLDNAEICSPVMMYLFHRIDALLDGGRMVINIDEFWKALGSDAFKAFAQDGLKTYRKRNALMVFGTQSPADALRSSIAHSIIEQVATKILLPNPNGSEQDYCGGLGLTKAEFRLIREDLTPESRCFLIKQGHRSVVAQLDLSGMGDELAVLSGREETLRVMEATIETYGHDPLFWLPEFQRLRGSS